MSGRDAARDELAEIIRQVDFEPGRTEPADAVELADVLLSRGYRRSVTPEQIEACAEATADADGSRCFKPLHDGAQDERDEYRDYARIAARAFGLEVTEPATLATLQPMPDSEFREFFTAATGRDPDTNQPKET